ncbi:MAG: class I SAM-dependent methyltransferase [Lutibacter sp.]|jgi:ubiquinone/menaquinone biosynthesis C-methylase UbiE
MANIRKLVSTWNREARSYRFDKDSQVDYLANFYHLVHNFVNLKGKKILEVGSGTGQESAYLASMGGIIHLVDISSTSLKFSEKYFASKNLSVKLYHQNAFTMKFPAESFDYVWNGGVIEHFNDKDKVLILKKMWKLVKPGGKLLITVPNALDFPFMMAKKILELRKKWSFGDEDDLTIQRMKKLAKFAEIKTFSIYAYNPIVGFWFFPYGREIMDFLGLNTLRIHKTKTPFGHVIMFCAKKPSKV